jgi:hypothetical protein
MTIPPNLIALQSAAHAAIPALAMATKWAASLDFRR